MLQSSPDPKERFVLWQHMVDSIMDAYYAQALFADYVLQAHRLAEKGQSITPEVRSGICRKLSDDYGDAIEIDDL